MGRTYGIQRASLAVHCGSFLNLLLSKISQDGVFYGVELRADYIAFGNGRKAPQVTGLYMAESNQMLINKEQKTIQIYYITHFSKLIFRWRLFLSVIFGTFKELDLQSSKSSRRSPCPVCAINSSSDLC